MNRSLFAILLVITAGSTHAVEPTYPVEQQHTFAPKNHDLDNNDNFSPDDQWLCYDTRETDGVGIDNCRSIEALNLATGEERVLYAPHPVLTGSRPAPGVGAVSFSPVENSVIFIHGPAVAELDTRGPYAKPNRQGAIVSLDGSGVVRWADCRDVATDRDTLPGAHRGGTHRHEYAPDGRYIGFTYDDFLLPQYDCTIGCMVPSAKAPCGASHYFMILVPMVPKDTAKPGEIEKAWGDSWAAPDGSRRAFIGKIRNDDGNTYDQSLFVVDLPHPIDLASIDSGGPDRYPRPPKGTKIHRITHTWADGVVRGAPDGSQIAYYARDPEGQLQIFLVATDGSDHARHEDKRPRQLTRFPGGVSQYLRWHPSGRSIACLSARNGLAAVSTVPGPGFGEVTWLSPEDTSPERTRLVLSHDGKTLAYNKPTPATGTNGAPQRSYDGKDFQQIYTVPYPSPSLSQK